MNKTKQTILKYLSVYLAGKKNRLLSLIGAGVLLFGSQSVNAKSPKEAAKDESQVQQLLNRYAEKIYFTQNKGQFNSGVLFKADFPLGQALATPQGMLIKTFDPLSLSARADEGERIEREMQMGRPFRPIASKVKGHGWMMHFLKSSDAMTIEGIGTHPDAFNYFGANNTSAVIGATNFKEVWYKNVYSNVDVRYYTAQDGTLEYDIIAKPGFKANEIAIEFQGIQQMTVDASGQLIIPTSVGQMIVPAPVVYQQVNGLRVPVTASYVVSNGNVLGFSLGKFNRNYPVLIDPIALRWATWVNTNSSSDNHGHCIWVDPSDGAIYMVARVVGTTDQITVGAFDESANGNLDMIVGKYLEPASVGQSGTRVWQTYIGGAGDDNPYAMEQGPDGNLYITGYTASANFPLLGGSAFSGTSIDQRSQGTNNIFVTKINTDGNSIKSSVIGGNNDDGSFDIRIDNSGDLIVCGNTHSTNLSTLYSGSGASNTNHGDADVLIFKLNQDLSSVIWMKNYGGGNDDLATIMLQNSDNGDIYIGGYTSSSDFPVSDARQSALGGSQSGFIQKLLSNGNTAWSSYFKSASNKTTSILCMEFSYLKDQLYFGGVSNGLDASNVSSSGVLDNSFNGSNDFFVALMDTAQNLVASTYLGGSGNEVNMMGLNTDQNNDVYIFGYSNSTDFPVSALPNTPLQTNNLGSNDKTFTKLSSSLATLEFSTYYGGSGDDYDPVGERGIKFSNCRIYTIVTSRSGNLPLTQGALNTTKNSGSGVYEPGLVVWANPPDLLGNTITGNQSICAGNTPGDITGSTPAYVLPVIERNGATNAYPSLGSAATYQWQISTDSLNWTNIAGATNQDLSGASIGQLFTKTFFRRIIGGDACVLAGVADQVVTVKIASVSGSVTNAACFGTSTGSIFATSDGTAPFTYDWSDGQTSETASGLAAGSYTVTVTDVNGCSASQSFTVTEPTMLTVSATGSTVTCSSGAGHVTAMVSGGTPAYNYNWNSSPSQGTSTATGLDPGVYTVTVTDANQCMASATATVNASDPILASLTVNAATCNANDGSIIVNVTSGTAPFTYTWNPLVSNSNAANGLTPGLYEVTVADANGCSTTLNGVVNASGISAFVVSQTDATCSNSENGSATVAGSGGTAPYDFLWLSLGDTTATVSSLAPGTYTVRVSDYLGCPAYVTVTIGFMYAAPVVDLGADFTACNGFNEVLDAGAGFNAYLWSNNSTAQTLSVNADGNYAVVVTDANGCQAMDYINVDFVQCVRMRNDAQVVNANVKVFPNPAHENLDVQVKNESLNPVNIQIVDVLGNVVYTSVEEAGQLYAKTIDLKAMSNGIYFVKVLCGSNEEIVRIVKQ